MEVLNIPEVNQLKQKKHVIDMNAVKLAIEKHAEAMESQNKMPQQLFNLMCEQGLFNLSVPTEYGGSETEILSLLNTIEEVATINGSAGWAVAISIGSGIALSFLGKDTAAKLTNGNLKPYICVNFAPAGVAKKVSGGYLVNGTWGWCSFCQCGDWLMLNCRILEDNQPHSSMLQTKAIFIPTSQVSINENSWHVLGLRGSGSQQVTVKDVLIPDEYVVPFFGSQSQLNRVLYRYPILTSLTNSIAAVALGLAKSSLTYFLDYAESQTTPGRGGLLKERPSAQIEVARAQAILHAARSYLYDSAQTLWHKVANNQIITIRDRALARLANVETTQMAAKVIQMLYDLAGGIAIFDTNPLQRNLRDINVVTHHFAIAKERYGSLGSIFAGKTEEDILI